MFAIGNEELEKKKDANFKTAKCPKCNKIHKIIWSTEVGENGIKHETRTLGAVKCCGSLWIVVLKGKLV